jgi:hypothetical protein
MNYTDDKGKDVRDRGNLDCIWRGYNGDNYECTILTSFNSSSNLDKINRLTKRGPECALIELLNNSIKK